MQEKQSNIQLLCNMLAEYLKPTSLQDIHNGLYECGVTQRSLLNRDTTWLAPELRKYHERAETVREAFLEALVLAQESM